MTDKSRSEGHKRFETPSGIDLPADFNPSNTDPIDYDKNLNSPGDFPYTRGIYSNMYRGRLWTMRQYAGYATAE
jgi:methylmalonyl-CoA mutase N-terminal domain/subunit